MKRTWRALPLTVVCAMALGAAASRADVASEVRAATGARTRIVWCRDAGNGADALARGDKLQLVGFDSHDGRGVRTILDRPANYAKPMIAPKGDRVVFSDRLRGKVFVVNFDGTGLRELVGGFALDVWSEPKTDRLWVYVKTGKAERKSPIRRYRIERPGAGELVWDKSATDLDSFQLSADGTRGGGQFPWPACGLAALPNRSFKQFGRGCWTALAPDNSYLLWYFDGVHRNLTIHAPTGRRIAKIAINSAPGISGYEVYHPRWSNHVRFMTMTGPYKVGRGADRIRGGGTDVEVYLGRFNKTLTDVEKWVRITYDRKGDFFPDAWVEPGKGPHENAYAAPKPTIGPTTSRPATKRKKPERVVVRARLVSVTATPEPRSILPYRRALVAYGYEVVEVVSGKCPDRKILAAHWCIVDGKVQPVAGLKPGVTRRLTLELFDEKPELESERLIMHPAQLDMPLYYDVGK